MSIKQKRYPKLKPAVIVVSIALLSLAGGGTLFALRNEPEASADRQVTESADSLFSFSGAADWRQGPTNKTSMALFHNSNSCFTSVEYKTGSVDVAAEVKKSQDISLSGEYTVTTGDILTLTLQTESGQKQYELHQSSVTVPEDALEVKRGRQFGYLQLSDGYLEIEGYCDTPEELPTTVPALEAIKLN